MNDPTNSKMFVVLHRFFMGATAVAALLLAVWHAWTLAAFAAILGIFPSLTSLRRKIPATKSGDRRRPMAGDLPISVSPRRLAIETACAVTVAFVLIFSGVGALALGLAGLGCATLIGLLEYILAKRRFKSLGT